ncbi:hypothetical protein ACX9R5_13925 [Rathayibacter sp. CAU 1779]
MALEEFAALEQRHSFPARHEEIADALYVVSTRQDGVSAVVGQRVEERDFRNPEREDAPSGAREDERQSA